MNLKLLDWEKINQKAEWELALTYHKYSGVSSYSNVLEKSRLKLLNSLLVNENNKVTTVKHYYSATNHELECNELGLDSNIIGTIKMVNEIINRRFSHVDLDIYNTDLYFFNQYWIVCEGDLTYILYYYNSLTNKLEKISEVSLEVLRSVFIEPIENTKVLMILTYNLRFAIELFGESAYRIGLIEAGSMINEIIQSKESFSRKAIIRFKDYLLYQLLSVNGDAEIPLAIFVD
jgi:hypothetical protein